MWARSFSHSASIIFPCTACAAASSAIAAITRSKASPASINIHAWPSPSSPTAKACATSKPACAPSAPSSTTWAFAGHVSRATLADANESRERRIHADFAHSLIAITQRLYVDDAFGVDLGESVHALDATTIDLCLSLFPWAPFQRSKAAIKQHLRIKRFFATAENAVKPQVWIAVCRLSAGRHHQQAPRHRRQSLHNPAASQRHRVRENAAPSGA